jgi:HprK-related kinase B
MIEKSKNGLIMHGVAKMPRINPGTALNNPYLSKIITAGERSRFADFTEDELWQVEHKYDALIEDCYGPDRFVLHAAMEGLVILNWKRNGAPTEVRPAHPALHRELLPAFMKNGDYPGRLDTEKLARRGIEVINCRLVSMRSRPYIDEKLLVPVLLSLT